jgi:hypothetical protein
MTLILLVQGLVSRSRVLSLDNNPVPGEAWHLLIKDESPYVFDYLIDYSCIICKYSSVQHLSVRYNGITAKGSELLGKALGNTTVQNTKLLSLNLNGNKVTDAGVQHLATVLFFKLFLILWN